MKRYDLGAINKAFENALKLEKLASSRKGYGTIKASGRISALTTAKSENPQKRSYKVSGGRTPRNVGRPTGESPFSPHYSSRPFSGANIGRFMVSSPRTACLVHPCKASKKNKGSLRKFLQAIQKKLRKEVIKH